MTELNEKLVKYCSDGKSVEKIKGLIKKGADIHYLNDRSFIYSCWFGRMEIVKFLLENRANIHAQDDKVIQYIITHFQ